MIAVQNSHIHFITNPFYRKSLSQKFVKEKAANPHSLRICGSSTKYRGYWIRTSGLYVPNVALYQTEPNLDSLLIDALINQRVLSY